ncbi:glycerol-3-phosphate 1-O-acyltransferase PlsY [bacterium]|nr:glycerol-3-phosphate 1-O-acyltransferase PlsY [bacterium]
MQRIMFENILPIIITAILAYLAGSVPTGYIVVKLAKNEDIREIGSGSTGATNVKRVMGKKWFFIVLLLDAIKGIIPVLLARTYVMPYSDIGLAPVIAATAVILGHSKSIFLKFTGGKSVAAGVGTIIALSLHGGLLIASIWALITYTTKYVSLGSIIALALSPVIMYLFNAPVCYIIYCVAGAIYIIYLHRENIKRLIRGEENKVRE